MRRHCSFILFQARRERFLIPHVTIDLLEVARKVQCKYAELSLDLADEYRTNSVLTLDRRDFRAIRSLTPHKDCTMSLAVPADLLDRAQRGEVDDAAFLDCVRTSLPYAWNLITGLIATLEADGGEFAGNQVPPPDEAARGQLLRLMASDAMRAAIERRYGVRLSSRQHWCFAVLGRRRDQ